MIRYDFETFANLKYTLYVHSVTHGWTIEFLAMLGNYNEDYKANYTSEAVYGRMDPLRIYQNTERKITFSLNAMARDFGEGLHLQQKLGFLAANMYPSYETENDATTLKSPPYFKILFGNVINSNRDPYFQSVEGEDAQRQAFGPAGAILDNRDIGGSIRGYNVISNGLTGIIENFSISPDIDNLGFFTMNAPIDPTGAGPEEEGQELDVAPVFVPKGYTVDIDFAVIHNVKLGWAGGQQLTPSFPYGYNINQYGDLTTKFHKATPPTNAQLAADEGAGIASALTSEDATEDYEAQATEERITGGS